jgi:hypothetical protein
MTVEAGVGAVTAGAALDDVGAAVPAATRVVATDGVVDANDGRPAAVAGALTARGCGLVFIDVLPDAVSEVTRALRRASVPGASDVLPVVADPVDGVEVDGATSVVASDADEPVVVLVCRPPDLFSAPAGFSRRG